MSTEEIREVMDLIMYGDEEDFDHAKKTLIKEDDEERIVRVLGDSMLMNYLMKFEEYLDDHDIYLFKGWKEARVVGKPQIDKFWTTFDLWVSPETDMRGAMRLKNDKEGQNIVQVKELGEDRGKIVRFKILKRYLDAIEKRNKERAEQLSDEQLEEM